MMFISVYFTMDVSQTKRFSPKDTKIIFSVLNKVQRVLKLSMTDEKNLYFRPAWILMMKNINAKSILKLRESAKLKHEHVL